MGAFRTTKKLVQGSNKTAKKKAKEASSKPNIISVMIKHQKEFEKNAAILNKQIALDDKISKENLNPDIKKYRESHKLPINKPSVNNIAASNDVKMIPIEEVKPFIMENRRLSKKGRDVYEGTLDEPTDETISNISKDMLSGGSINNPLELSYDSSIGKALLTDGNTRLVALEDSGYTHVPVRVKAAKLSPMSISAAKYTPNNINPDKLKGIYDSRSLNADDLGFSYLSDDGIELSGSISQKIQSSNPTVDKLKDSFVKANLNPNELKETKRIINRQLKGLGKYINTSPDGSATLYDNTGYIGKFDSPDDAFRAANKEDVSADYKGVHSAPSKDDGAPLHNLSKEDVTGYPEDVYSPQSAQWYGEVSGGSPSDKESLKVIQSVRDNPDSEVTMYRAVPNDENITDINQGDWVSLSETYAKQHGESALNGDYKIISKKAPARKLFTEGNSLNEFGYDMKGSSKLAPLAGVAAGGVAVTGAYGAYNKYKDDLSESYDQTMDNISNRERPEHQGMSQKTLDKQNSVIDNFMTKRGAREQLNKVGGVAEMGVMMGSGYLGDILAGYSGILTGLGTKFAHNAADGLNRAGLNGDAVRPELSAPDAAAQTIENVSDATQYLPRTEKGQEYAMDLAQDANTIGNYWTTGLGAQGQDPIVNQMQAASEAIGTGEYTEGMQPVKQFNESAEYLYKKGYPGLASVLKASPDIL